VLSGKNKHLAEAQELFAGAGGRCFALPGDAIASVILGTVAYTPNALDLPVGAKIHLADLNEETGVIRALTGDGRILKRLPESWLKVFFWHGRLVPVRIVIRAVLLPFGPIR
jgi:hypothetical protein